MEYLSDQHQKYYSKSGWIDTLFVHVHVYASSFYHLVIVRDFIEDITVHGSQVEIPK